MHQLTTKNILLLQPKVKVCCNLPLSNQYIQYQNQIKRIPYSTQKQTEKTINNKQTNKHKLKHGEEDDATMKNTLRAIIVHIPYFCQLSCNKLISTQGSNKVV